MAARGRKRANARVIRGETIEHEGEELGIWAFVSEISRKAR